MRNLPALSAVVAALVGCAPAQHSPPALADNWVDQQIALSATSLSLAQQRVHQTAPVPKQPLPAAPVESAKGPITTVYTPTPVVAFTPLASSTPVKPAAATVVLPVSEKPLPQTPPVSTPAAPPLASSSFGVASASPGPVPPVTAGSPVPGTVKPATASVAKVDPKPGSMPATVTASSVSTKPATPVPAVPAPKPLKAFKVSPEGKTIRETLAQWAKDEGWTFNPIGRDYWTVPHDFDVVATETFYDDFIGATRKLIASTELTSTPLQPCFFKNKALRVIRINEECSPQASEGHKP